jgi:uncharacterized protein YggE
MFNQQVFKAAVVCAIATTLGLFIPKSAQAADFTSSNATLSGEHELQIAQAITTSEHVLSVTGSGIGRVPADQAAIILSYSLNYYSEMSSEPGAAPALPPAAQASDLKTVTDALVGAGVSASDIIITREPYSAQSLRMIIRVNNNLTRERITTLVDLAQNTGIKENKFMASISGVTYISRNCKAAEATALQAAMANARAQAEALAATANVSVGELINVSSSPSWGYVGPYPNSTCPTSLDDVIQAVSSYGAQPYDPAMPAEVTAGASVSLSYEMEP